MPCERCKGASAVQTACLDAIANWPDRFAVPLLLQAMRAPSSGVAIYGDCQGMPCLR